MTLPAGQPEARPLAPAAVVAGHLSSTIDVEGPRGEVSGVSPGFAHPFGVAGLCGIVPVAPGVVPTGATGCQNSQSSSSVLTALPMTYEEPDPEKKSWFSSAFGDRAERIAGLTSVSSLGNSASYPRFINALLAL